MSREYDQSPQDNDSHNRGSAGDRQNDDPNAPEIKYKGKVTREESEAMFSVKVNNVWDVEKEDLMEFFKDYQPVADIHIPWRFNEFTPEGKPKLKGYAFVRWTDKELCERALKELQNSTLNGRSVGLQWVEKRPPGRFPKEEGFRTSGYRPQRDSFQERRDFTRENRSSGKPYDRPVGDKPYRGQPREYPDEGSYERPKHFRDPPSYNPSSYPEPASGYYDKPSDFRSSAYPEPSYRDSKPIYPPTDHRAFNGGGRFSEAPGSFPERRSPAFDEARRSRFDNGGGRAPYIENRDRGDFRPRGSGYQASRYENGGARDYSGGPSFSNNYPPHSGAEPRNPRY